MPGRHERMVPCAHNALILNLGDAVDYRIPGSDWQRRPEAFITGLFVHHAELRFAGETRMLGVGFRPGRLHHFLPNSLGEVQNSFADIRDVYGGTAREWLERILEAPSPQAAAAILDSFLLGLLNGTVPDEDPLQCMVRNILHGKGNLSMARAAGRLAIGARHLRRKFYDSVGVNPKTFARIVRIDHCIKLGARGRYESLTDLGLQCGYYDQAHFIRDFKTVTGISPARFFNDPANLASPFIKGA